jgi:hypothetical protein
VLRDFAIAQTGALAKEKIISLSRAPKKWNYLFGLEKSSKYL